MHQHLQASAELRPSQVNEDDTYVYDTASLRILHQYVAGCPRGRMARMGATQCGQAAVSGMTLKNLMANGQGPFWYGK